MRRAARLVPHPDDGEPLAAAGTTAAGFARRHDPDRYASSFAYRPDALLPFDPAQAPRDRPLLLDTNFYVHTLKDRVPAEIVSFVGSRVVLHSSVACAELTISLGILDPRHPETARNRRAITALLDSISETDMVAPSAGAWVEAGMIAGILARTQHLATPKRQLSAAEACCQEGRRRKLLNDALIFLTACELGAILVSENKRDVDLLLRLRPQADVVLFSAQAQGAAVPRP